MRPIGQQRAQVGVRGRVGIPIAGHVLSPLPGALDPGEGLVELLPIPLARRLQVADLKRQPRRCGRVHHLVHRLEKRVSLAAHVGGQKPPLARRDPAKGGEFFFIRETGRRIDQSGGQTEGTLRHSRGEHSLHRGEFLRAGRARHAAYYARANRVVPHQVRIVDRYAHIIHVMKVLANALKREVQVELLPVPFPALLRLGPANRGGGVAAVASHVGRHPLADLRVRLGIDEEVVIRMTVNIDESGTQRQTSRVDLAMSGAAHLGTNLSDGVSANGERTFIRGVAQTVEYHGMVKYDVIHRGLPGAEAARPSSLAAK